MRGALGNRHLDGALVWIIPADAGSTSLKDSEAEKPEDHPRGCGEHRFRPAGRGRAGGSSPRMRGALGDVAQQLLRTGIIPADAGSTTAWAKWSCPGQDHPRGCGEHGDVVVKMRPLPGSSPRMRGALGLDEKLDTLKGIIPADAGSTALKDFLTEKMEDHPRGCGEHFLPSPDQLRHWGSSPRMRGARKHGGRAFRQDGIIPADAGSTSSCPAPVAYQRDHPRGCGEHCLS